MNLLGSCVGSLALLQALMAVVQGWPEMNIANTSCVPAHPPINASLLKQKCSPYKFPNGYCKHIIGKEDVYASDEEQSSGERSYIIFFRNWRIIEKYRKVNVRASCLKVWIELTCQDYFPKCDQTSGKPMQRPVCKETCNSAMKLCDEEAIMLRKYNDLQANLSSSNKYPLYWRIPDCRPLKFRNGGDPPECFFSRRLISETDKLEATDCYYGNGLGYRGNINITRSGHACQSWSSQCPHRHDHPLSEYPELVNASNWCRNPGGQGPNGPWCYTTNSSIRWEYCDVEKCPPPAPTRAPDSLEAYASGPSTISISWDPVPLPFIHGQHRGYKVQISNNGQEQMVNMTSPKITSFGYSTLKPLTNYSISVLAFNDAGDGPLTRVYVKTMPENYIAARYSLTSAKRGITRNSSSKLETMMVNSFKNRPPSGYSIFQIKIARFINSSNQIEFDITAELTGRQSWSAVQDITGRILKSLKENSKMANEFQPDSLIVKASPPPPASLSARDVQRTSVILDWSAPLYHKPYRISSYSLQYKKAGTDMEYYDADTLNSNITKIKVGNLDVGKKYLMRVVSVNSYGSEASESLEVQLQQGLIETVLSIVLPLCLVVIIVASALGTWWYKKRNESKEIQKTILKLRDNPYESCVDWFDVLKIKISKQWWEIPRGDLALDEELGSGAFGVVMKGYLIKREEGTSENRITCAVKMLKDNPTEKELRDLCNEINVMSSVGDHPNLVALIGACTINGPPWLVVKFAPNGCLLDYLKDNRPVPEYQNTSDLPKSESKPISDTERIRFALEIAQGMAHLEKNRFAHRDLAARNILLGKNMVAMVSDFGLSRDIYESGAYENTTGGFLPVRWMALESLQDYTYTSMSDVWSFGVVLWEIESGGLVPYTGMSGSEVVERLRQGYRLEKPHNTSRDIYGIMWQCWKPDPNQRPTFADLVDKIKSLLDLSADHEDRYTKSAHENNVNKKNDTNSVKKHSNDKGLAELKDPDCSGQNTKM